MNMEMPVYQRTRVLVLVHSHVNAAKKADPNGGNGNVIDLSADVISLQTQKTTTAMGRWQIHLVPNRNYLNMVFPNDVVNIYIDPGDGKRGFIRTMMGYVDRVDQTINTLPDGSTTTQYTIIGSDFQKAIDRTSLYFNAYMRQILDERYARTSEGAIRGSQRNDAEGSALRNAGVTMYGSPADLIENFLLTMLGFGSQWRLPDSYPRESKQIIQNIANRKQRALDKIPEALIELINKLGLHKELVDGNVDKIINKLQQISTEETSAEKMIGLGIIIRAQAIQFRSSPELLAYRASLPRKDANERTNILDLMTFDFIESLAVDGFNSNNAINTAQSGTLGQFLYGNSNDFINELIFDLRPVSAAPNNKDGGFSESHGLEGYSRLPDELGVNVQGSKDMPSSVSAVKYVPAVVFREYPYSVVEDFDISGVMVVPAAIDPQGIASPGLIKFGPVFAQNPGVSGRHLYVYEEKLSVTSSLYAESAKAVKHIDAIAVTSADIVNSSLGRSDEDTFNVMQLTPQGITNINDQFRSVLTNFSPVMNQVSIARHGLRVWEGSTSFANYGSLGPNPGVGGSTDNAQIRRNLVRWQLLMDHWYQHNIEYITGTITLRGMPEIRVGYRLDWNDRNESYYVEGVSHNWQFPGALQTTVSVSRGQRNDPFPAYVPPVFLNRFDQVVQSSGDRTETGRLGRFFLVRDPLATQKSVDRKGPFFMGRNETDEGLDRNSVSVKSGATKSGFTGFADYYFNLQNQPKSKK